MSFGVSAREKLLWSFLGATERGKTKHQPFPWHGSTQGHHGSPSTRSLISPWLSNYLAEQFVPGSGTPRELGDMPTKPAPDSTQSTGISRPGPARHWLQLPLQTGLRKVKAERGPGGNPRAAGAAGWPWVLPSPPIGCVRPTVPIAQMGKLRPRKLWRRGLVLQLLCGIGLVSWPPPCVHSLPRPRLQDDECAGSLQPGSPCEWHQCQRRDGPASLAPWQGDQETRHQGGQGTWPGTSLRNFPIAGAGFTGTPWGWATQRGSGSLMA